MFCNPPARWKLLSVAIGILFANTFVLLRRLSLGVGSRQSAAANDDAMFVLPQEAQGSHHHVSSLMAKSAAAANDSVNSDDMSWLSHIKVGKFLGSGKYSDTFIAVFDDDYYNKYMYHQAQSALSGGDSTNSGNTPDCIIRITGNYRKGVISDSKLRASERAWRISQRLSPHPSIPTMLHYVRHTPNPFLDGRLDFAQNSTRKLAIKHNDGRLFKATNVSIDVTERVYPTVEHCNSRDGLLAVPVHKVRCFWRQLFETMSYVHSKGVAIRDTKLWNFMVQDGKIVLFDFNLGHMADVGSREYEQIHVEDVQHFGKRIREYVESQRGNTTAIEQPSSLDLDLLEDLSQIMMIDNKSPPTMTWLLENNKYFLIEGDDECLLQW
mmetsp:Transcript_2728/g.8011  ORF Transcript_2728/g.8011 Transcript_2728/m.8011 type:complete len:381 (+) Transcript_2728:255-1397(+)